jgi:hypothetical protein
MESANARFHSIQEGKLLMNQQLPDLHMHVEVMGCPTICQHCWAVGRPYQAMPLEEISWVLHEIRHFCDAHNLTVDGYPMHEVAAHPQAAQIMTLFHDVWGVIEEPVPTTGVPLSTRDDWRELLDTLRSLGTSTLWFAFHGANEIHDQAVLRKGAYQESLHAVELAREAEMKAGCNLFLTKENIAQFDQIITDLQSVGIQQIIPEIYSFVPNARGRHSEPLRPEWTDVEPLVEKLDAIPETAFWRRFWYELPDKHTESWYVRQASEGSWPTEPTYRLISLVCRPNLDVYRGLAGLYTRRYGNLRDDGVDRVLSRAVADSPSSEDELWFTPDQLLPVQQLAARFGEPHSQRIHMHAVSIRRWWLECARRL